MKHEPDHGLLWRDIALGALTVLVLAFLVGLAAAIVLTRW